MKRELVENKHYYLENGRVVFTELFLSERGYCCGNKCRHCPYFPKWTKGTIKINNKDSEEDLIFDKI